ncbi:MAG: type II secretion system secretin GspD [Desulfuromonadales bacterium]|nr:type II secretion system secretin GspD [Desulfuromonadales bacterium]
MLKRLPRLMLVLLVCLTMAPFSPLWAQEEEEESAPAEVTPPGPAPAPGPGQPEPPGAEFGPGPQPGAPGPGPGPAAAPAPRGAAPAKPATKGGKVSLDFRDIELTDLIQTISELTGTNFIYDETVKGRATIISPDPMTLDQAYNLFLTVLSVKGYTVVPAGRVNKVVPIRDAKENNLPTFTGAAKVMGDQYITRLVTLNNVDAAMVATTLAPLVPKTSSVVAYPPANTLIITDSAANVERLVRIINQLDQPSGVDLMEVISLQYADANEVAQLINQILAQGGAGTAAPRTRARAAQAAAGQEGSRVIPYPRTNALIALATIQDMELIRSLVVSLDDKPTQAHAGIYVYYLENADAETLATTLNQIVTGVRPQPRATATAARTPGQPGQPAVAGQPGQALGQVAITADKPTNALIVNSTPEDYEILRGIIRQLDGRRKQVFVEALIIELSMDATKRLGASLQGAFAVDGDGMVLGTSNLNQTQAGLSSFLPTAAGVPSLLTQSLNGILLGGMFNPISVTAPDGSTMTVPALSALIDVSRTTGDVNILSAPRLLTSDNEEAEIIVGQNVPIITQRLTDTGGIGLAQSVSVERRDVALTLRFTPQVTEGNLVRLNVMQEITDIAATAVGDVNQVGPTLTKRLLRNTVLAENGRTVVLGGLISNNRQETVSKVPLLGDIPGLGWLFKHTRTTDRKVNLLVFITPRIVRTPDDLANVTRRSRADMEQFQVEAFVPQINIDGPEALQIPQATEPLMQ